MLKEFSLPIQGEPAELTELQAIEATINHVASLLDDSTASSVLGPMVIDRDVMGQAGLLAAVIREPLDDWDEIAQLPDGRRFVMADEFFAHVSGDY